MNPNLASFTRTGWAQKENSKQWFNMKSYTHKYLALDSKRLIISQDANFANNFKEISLPQIFDVKDGQVENSFEVQTNERIYVFRVANNLENVEWKKAINDARQQIIRDAQALQNNTMKNSLTSSQLNHGSTAIVSSFTLKDASVYESNEDLINLLKSVTANRHAIEEAAHIFFKQLKFHPAKQRIAISKAMGRAVALWLLPVDEDTPNRDSGNLSHPPYDNEEVLRVWMRVALQRELHTSCKFEGQVGVGEKGSVHGDNQSVSSSGHGSVSTTLTANGSRPVPAIRRGSGTKRGSSIMPFRADSAECLFLASLVHAISKRSQLLTRLLYPVLYPLSVNSEGYIFAPLTNYSTRPPGFVQIDQSTLNNSGTAGDGGGGGNFVTRRLRSLAERVTGRTTSRSNSPAASTSTTTNTKGNNNNNDAISTFSSPTQQRAEQANNAAVVRGNIYDLLQRLLSHLDGIQERNTLPTGIDTLIRVVRDITVSTTVSRGGGATDAQLQLFSLAEHDSSEFKQNEDVGGQNLRSVSNDNTSVASAQTKAKNRLSYNNRPQAGTPVMGNTENLSAEEHAELYEQFVRFEHGRYYTSCTALLFLRLICPAIINPDWMPLPTSREQNTTATVPTEVVPPRPPSPDFSLTSIGTNDSKGENNEQYTTSTAAMVLFAHCLTGIPPGMKFSGNSSGSFPNSGMSSLNSPQTQFGAHATTSTANDNNNNIRFSNAENSNSTTIVEDGIATIGSPTPATPNIAYHLSSPNNNDNSNKDSKESLHEMTGQMRLTMQNLAQTVADTVTIEEANKIIDVYATTVNQVKNHIPPPAHPLNIQEDYTLDLMHMPTRKALAEVAKALLHISNIACLPKDEMQFMAQDALIRAAVSTGQLDKDLIDNYVLSVSEQQVVATQLKLASMIKNFYESVGGMSRGHW